MKNQKFRQENSSSSGKYFFLALTGILLLAAGAFSNCLKNDWLTNWDDNIYILNSPLVQDLSANGIKKIFTTFETDNYHPLTTLTYAIDFKLFGFNPYHFHLHNLLLHLFNVVLVFWFIRLLTGRWEASAIVAVFFAVHPMHVESVLWISERKDVLYTLFYLVALIAYVFYLKKKDNKYLVYTFLFFLCSLLSKSAAVSFSLMLFLLDYYFNRKATLKNNLEKIPFLLLSFVFGLVAISSQSLSGAIRVAPDFAGIDRILICCYGILFYIEKLFIPINLSALYLYPQKVNGMLPWVFYLAPVIILFVTIGIYKVKKIKKELIFGMLFYLISIVLVLQIIPVGRAIVADRYSYIPYIGLLYIIAELYLKLPSFSRSAVKKAKTIFTFSLLVAIAICAGLTFNRNKVWKNSLLLITDAIEKQDGKLLYKDYLYTSRGVANDFFKDYKGAIADYDESLKINPKNADVYFNRGVSKQNINDVNGAIEDYTNTLKAEPNYPRAYLNRGNLKIDLKKFEDAITDFDKALRLDSAYADAYNNRGAAKYMANKNTEACDDWQKAVQFGGENAKRNIAKYCK